MLSFEPQINFLALLVSKLQQFMLCLVCFNDAEYLVTSQQKIWKWYETWYEDMVWIWYGNGMEMVSMFGMGVISFNFKILNTRSLVNQDSKLYEI